MGKKWFGLRTMFLTGAQCFLQEGAGLSLLHGSVAGGERSHQGLCPCPEEVVASRDCGKNGMPVNSWVIQCCAALHLAFLAYMFFLSVPSSWSVDRLTLLQRMRWEHFFLAHRQKHWHRQHGECLLSPQPLLPLFLISLVLCVALGIRSALHRAHFFGSVPP